MKVGIIRCMLTEDICPGTDDFIAIREHTGIFTGVEDDIELVGFYSCGGCPGDKAVKRALRLADLGADTVAFSTCIQLGKDHCFPCPYAERMKTDILSALGERVTFQERSHD